VSLPEGGGRVSQLTARPALALFYPDLAGIRQPLAGEVAARRELLERLPFTTGYGVEIAMLIDVLELVGLDAMAQVDLARRKHRNSDLHKLGRMAVEILQVAEARLGRDVGSPVVLSQFVRSGDDYRIVDTDMTELERPPIVTLSSYANRHRR
jgi:glucosyl-3-phosphoglycerate synthase